MKRRRRIMQKNTAVHPAADSDLMLAESAQQEAGRLYPIVKRGCDFVFSLLVSILLLLPLALLALLVFIKNPGNPFFVQKRVGKDGKAFWLVKLRTMCRGADDLEHTLTPEQLAEYRREYKLENDPRIIGWEKNSDDRKCFGAFLRRTSLDELPQIIWNICIKGDMSFVGPRPILQEELERNYTPRQQELLLSVKPGLTGYWQAYARNKATYENGERQRMELYYVQHCSLLLDIKVLFATLPAVLRSRGAK